MPEAKIEETVCEDKISELPDDLLVMILSFVPTKDAVATMFLSKRWFSIWTMVRTLEYEDSHDEKEFDDERKKSVWYFLEKSLQFHKAHVIDHLHVELGPRCPTDADIGKLITNAVDRLVFNLYLDLFWSADPISLPMSLYTCESLQTLTLSNKILVDFPTSSCLPSLSVLNIYNVVYKDEASLVRLLSSCPVLRILDVERENDDNVTNFSVKVPSLWDLCYNKITLPDESDVVDTGRCLVIDTPALEKFSITDYSGDSCSIENMPCLKDAYIDVEPFPVTASDNFIRSLSSVLILDLALTNEVAKRCSTINLSQLEKLRICSNGTDWLEPLTLLLGNAPKLKILTVDCEFPYKPKDHSLSWNQPRSVPTCLSSKLEIFKWKDYGDSIEEEEFLTYILANSKCLKIATSFFRSTSFDMLVEQDLIIHELKDILRVSSTSKFSISGIWLLCRFISARKAQRRLEQLKTLRLMPA